MIKQNPHHIDRIITRIRLGWNQKLGPFVYIAAYVSLPEIVILKLYPNFVIEAGSAAAAITSYVILLVLSYKIGEREERLKVR